VGDQREIVRLLYRTRRQQRHPGLPDGHHVGVVTEDRQRVRRDGPGRDVHGERRELAGDLVEIRDHQQQALRRSERRGQRSRLQRPVHGANGSCLGLHFHDVWNRAPDVGTPGRRPLVGQFAHG